MKKELTGTGIYMNYCDFCKVFIADAKLNNEKVVCFPCAREKGIPISKGDEKHEFPGW